MFEIEHFGPRIPKIRHPRYSEFQGNLAGYQVHAVRRTCTYNYIYRMFFEIAFEKRNGRSYPHDAWIRDE